MAIKLIRGRPHLYRSVRDGGKVRSVYRASGAKALALAERDEEIRAGIKAKREADVEVERLTSAWFGEIERAVRLALESRGYRRHKRGEWRRKRKMNNQGEVAIRAGTSALDVARRSDPGGDIARHVVDTMLRREVPNEALAAAIRRRVELVQVELAGPDPSPAEALLAERAASCWLAVYLAEWSASSQLPGRLVPLADYDQRRVDAAHRRYLSSLRTLAVVRKLGVPDLQVNIDARSVRMASVPTTGDLGHIDDGRAG